MALTTYCSFEEVRSALGVNDIELSDAVLSLPVYEIGLVRELGKVSVSLPVAFSAILSIDEASRTDAAKALLDGVRLFSVYACAKQVGVSLGAMAPKDVGDGKATISRFSDSPYRDVLNRVEQMYLATRNDLPGLLSTYNGSATATTPTTPRVFFAASTRGSDPVTGA